MDWWTLWTHVDFVDARGLVDGKKSGVRETLAANGQRGGMRLIQKHGGYKRLKSFQVAQLVHDVTVRFVERYIDRFSRTRHELVWRSCAETPGVNARPKTVEDFAT